MIRYAKIAAASLLTLSAFAPQAAFARDDIVIKTFCPIGTIAVGWLCIPMTKK